MAKPRLPLTTDTSIDEFFKSLQCWFHRKVLGHHQVPFEVVDWRLAQYYDAKVECHCAGPGFAVQKIWWFR